MENALLATSGGMCSVDWMTVVDGIETRQIILLLFCNDPEIKFIKTYSY